MEDIYSRKYIVNFLRETGVLEYKILHSIAVAVLALKIAGKVSKDENYLVDKKIVEAGALLHDIGISKTIDDLSPNHSSIGGELVRAHNYSEEIARCIEDHEYVIWSREDGEKLDMIMIRESFRPETWEEKVVSYADHVVFVYSECNKVKDFWEDLRCLQKASLPYWVDVFKKYFLGDLDATHPFIVRQYGHQKEMKKFVDPSFFADEEYKDIAEKMQKAQIEYGLKVPFAYADEL
jgi:putative nucleotidyltransferase with HDIG domain